MKEYSKRIESLKYEIKDLEERLEKAVACNKKHVISVILVRSDTVIPIDFVKYKIFN